MSHDPDEPSVQHEDSGTESVIDTLLLMEREPGRVPMYIGEPHVLSMNGFILGFELCLSARGIIDRRHARFRGWLRDVEKGRPPDDWYVRNLQESGGDHLQAIRRLLDRVSEFHTLGEPDVGGSGQAGWQPPSGSRGLEVESTIDMLLHIREELSRLPMYLGELNVLSLNGLILGFRICLSTKGNTDERYYRFREWLREVKREFPPEGWCAKYLRDCNGDHLGAIRKFLDRVAEYQVQEEHLTR
jgi:hypothetical protein